MGSDFDYSLAMERIKNVTGCKTQQDLAKFLGVSQSCISDAKKRMAIPAEWLLKLLQKQSVNPDWVRSGIGAQYLQPTDSKNNVLSGMAMPHPPKCLMQEFLYEFIKKAMDGKEQ